MVAPELVSCRVSGWPTESVSAAVWVGVGVGVEVSAGTVWYAVLVLILVTVGVCAAAPIPIPAARPRAPARITASKACRLIHEGVGCGRDSGANGSAGSVTAISLPAAP